MKQHQTGLNNRISCLALAEGIWLVSYGCNPNTKLCCLTSALLGYLSNSIIFIARKYCYNKAILDQIKISFFFMQSLYMLSFDQVKVNK